MRRTAPISDRALLPILALLAAGCAAGAPATPEPSPETARRQIAAMLEASAEAWNRGDLDAFVGDYAEDATFVGSRGLVRGAAEIRRLYAQGYWSSGAPADALRFELLDVRVPGPGVASAVGRYLLFDRATGETTATGLFTLLLERNSRGWTILHDHSSADSGG